MYFLKICLFLGMFCFCKSAKILAIYNIPTGSHYKLASKLFTAVANRGHEVTFITPYPSKRPVNNLKEIPLESLQSVFVPHALFEQVDKTPFEKAIFANNILFDLANHTISHPKIQDLMNSNVIYDAVILYYYLNDALLAMAHHFRAPVILFASMPLVASENFLLSQPTPSSYVPNMLTEHTGRMDFFQRLKNTFYDVGTILYYYWFMLPEHKELVEKYVPGKPDLYGVLNKESLILINSHVSTTEALPMVPNAVEIGGFHIEEPKPLPEDLQKFLDNSTNGVILFSMGSILRSANMPKDKRDSLINAFSKLKENILWKFEDDNPAALPKNVKTMKWIPQSDVLAHPNVKAFISHGGLLSTMESVYHGVPIIGIPVMVDQKMNIALAAAYEYAIQIRYQELTEDRISHALDQILNNPKYKVNIKKRSKIMRDRPINPLDNALYWIEYVIRHQGAPHLRYPGMDLNWFQRNLLDVAAFVTVVTISPVVILITCLKKILKSDIKRIFNVPAGSHYMLASRLFTEIAKRGHDVTFITPFSQKEPTENLKEVELESLRTVFTNFASMYEQAKVTPLEKAININKILLQVTNHTISHPKIQDLINSNEQYDAVILYYYLNDALLALAHHFKAPVILFAPTPLYASQSFLLSHPAPSSYVPNMLAEYTGRMNFWQRLKNSFYDVTMILYYQWFMLPKHRELVKKYIPGQSKFYDILNNESLVLVNTHLSINEAVPVIPNVIEIGGYHFEEVKALPEDLQKFLDGSKNGVVLFTMGSILKSADLPRQKRDALIGAFSKLKQNVLWKFEENLPNLPKNVKIMKWIPQFDLLAHPNIKGFINHGGLLSVMESVYHGVPIIGIPIMADHKMNMALAAANGYGIELQYQELTEEKILQALDQILNDTKYRDDVQRRSKIMRDRPVKPLENALYWIEYVIRHQGAPHFRYPGMDLNWFQRNLLDIAACIISLTILTFITLVVCLKRYCKSVKQKKE